MNARKRGEWTIIGFGPIIRLTVDAVTQRPYNPPIYFDSIADEPIRMRDGVRYNYAARVWLAGEAARWIRKLCEPMEKK